MFSNKTNQSIYYAFSACAATIFGLCFIKHSSNNVDNILGDGIILLNACSTVLNLGHAVRSNNAERRLNRQDTDPH